MTKISLQVTPELLRALLTARIAVTNLADDAIGDRLEILREAIHEIDQLRVGMIAADCLARSTPRASS